MKNNINEIRSEIEDKINTIISEKYSGKWFSPYAFFDPSDESHKDCLAIFKYLYSIGGDAHIFLWNRLIYNIIYRNQDTSLISKDEFSTDEWIFIENIIQQQLKNTSKWGKHYNTYENINTLSSKILSLVPWSEELNLEYVNHFLSSIKEYESYFGKDCDGQDEIICNCSQKYRPLSFAIKLSETNELIGQTALNLINNDALYNLEYYIFPKYRNNGYAYEAVNLLINTITKNELVIREDTVKYGVYGEKIASIKCIETKIRSNNFPSLRLVEKLGFEKTGVIPFFEKHQDIYYDGIVYHYIV